MMWCIALFTSPADAEVIVGDLQEERSAIAMRHGDRVARWWYWRQALRTTAQLAAAPLCESPLTSLLVGVLGLGLVLPLMRGTDWLASQIVVPFSIYERTSATSFWFAASVVPYLLVGVLASAARPKRAMSDALAVLIVMSLKVTAIDPIRLVTILPPDRLPTVLEYLTHAVPALSIYGTAVLSAAAAGVSFRRRAT